MERITEADIRSELRPSAAAPPGRIALELIHDGSRPPEAVFDALAAIGWRRPVASPPPKDAVDWSTPDPLAGRRYTVRPFVAVAILEPVGNPVNGTLAALLTATIAVARALGISVDPELAPPVARRRRISLVVREETVDVVAAVVPPGAVVDRRPRSVRHTTTYRGGQVETEIPAAWLLLEVSESVATDVLDALSQLPVLVAPRIEGGGLEGGGLGGGGT